ncbi:MAG: DNA polymerase I [bacterium]|nr:DNA polymerase I [bacterium]
MRKLFLIDLMSVFFKSHMAMERHHLTTGDGLVVSGINGVMLTLARLIRSEAPSAVVVTTDTPAPTFRHQLYPAYKANRPPMPAEMAAQLPVLFDLLELAGLPAMRLEGWEADDLLGTCAQEARRQGWEVFVLTADKDLMQIVQPGIFLFTPQKGGEVDLVGEERVREKFGVAPGQVVDVLALMGDSSDNVPGVPGVGIKTAADLVGRFGDLDGVYANLAELGQKAVRAKLENNRDLAYLSKRLVTIDCQVPCAFDPLRLPAPAWGSQTFLKRLGELGLRMAMQHFAALEGGGAPSFPPAPAVGDTDASPSPTRLYHTVATRAEVEAFATRLLAETRTEPCAFDLETTGLDAHQCSIVGFSFSWRAGEAWYLPARLKDGAGEGAGGGLFDTAEAADELAWVLARLRPWYEAADHPKLGQNAKYDLNVLAQHGVTVRGVVFDTMLASYVLRPAGRRHDLDSLSLQHLGLAKIPTSDLIGSGAKQISMADVPLEKIAEYACEDADCVRQLWPLLEKELREAGLDALYRRIDLPMLAVLARMEQAGVKIDRVQLQDLSKELAERMVVLEAEIHALAGEAFNLNSPRQLAVILYEKLRLKPGRKTASGWSTDVDELERLAAEDALPRLLLEYRQLAKLKGTYSDALPLMVNPRTGRVHTNFNQTIAATGRLSSTDPNLQNIPIRTDWGRRIRRAFVADGPGQILIDVDYSQIELRLLAHISGDAELIGAFRDGADIHARTAAGIFHVAESAVDADMRRQAKVVNFGVIYGMGAFALAGNLGISQGEAKRFIEDYFTLYRGVKDWSSRLIEEARERGYVENIFGRRRYLPDLKSANRQLREGTERIAVNTPIQGSAADLIKLAMLNIDARLGGDLRGLRMISQVHDELLFEAPREEAPRFMAEIRREMESVVPLQVPLVAEPAMGACWLEAK